MRLTKAYHNSKNDLKGYVIGNANGLLRLMPAIQDHTHRAVHSIKS